MPRLIANDATHAHFVALSAEWCRLWEEFHTNGTLSARKRELRTRKVQIETEQEELLTTAKNENNTSTEPPPGPCPTGKPAPGLCTSATLL
jgi:hypothetical protein